MEKLTLIEQERKGQHLIYARFSKPISLSDEFPDVRVTGFRVPEEYAHLIKHQIENFIAVELKFCVEDDDDADDYEFESYTIVLFPRYENIDDESTEIYHSTVVETSDTLINGNLILCTGADMPFTTNHAMNGYSELQNTMGKLALNIAQTFFCEDGIES